MAEAISEEMVARYVELNEQAKRVKSEMDKLKHLFHTYFDETIGSHEKAELSIGDYFLQRQIRISDSYDEEKTVKKLEELQLGDCIEYIKKPDEQKIEAAIQLGILKRGEISDFLISKKTQAITVKKMR